MLSLFEDIDENVWLGLDNGISNINFNVPFRVYKDDLGVLGSVYTTFLDDGVLYLGTNQGLFYKDKKDRFRFVPGTEGQVWSLQKFKNTLFCGHDKGIFIISKGKADRISNTFGTWLIKEISGKEDLLLLGNYKGLYVLQNKSKKWNLRNKIKGFDISSRYLEFISPNELLVSHEQSPNLPGSSAIAIGAPWRRTLRNLMRSLGGQTPSPWKSWMPNARGSLLTYISSPSKMFSSSYLRKMTARVSTSTALTPSSGIYWIFFTKPSRSGSGTSPYSRLGFRAT